MTFIRHPYNRAQLYTYLRFLEVVCYTAVTVLSIVFALLHSLPTYAATPTNYNPNNVANVTTSGMPSVIYSCMTAGTCNVIIYHANATVNQGDSYKRTCIESFPSNTNTGHHYLTSELPTRAVLTLPGGYNHSYCWEGGSWTSENVPRIRWYLSGASGSLINLALTTFDLLSPGGDFSASYNSLGNTNSGDVLVPANWFPNGGIASLSAVGFPPYLAGTDVPFQVTAEQLNFTGSFLHFHEDIEDDADNVIPLGTSKFGAGSGSESFVFYHSFSYAGSYHPYVDISNCETADYRTAPGCSYKEADANTTTIQSAASYQNSLTTTYASTFSAYPANDVLVGNNVSFVWSLSPSFCAPGTVTGYKLFEGYPRALSYKDAGTSLLNRTGATLLAYAQTAQPYSDYFFPYIRVYCSNLVNFDVYLGGVVTFAGATPSPMPQGISVYEEDDVRFSLPDQWLNGNEDGYAASGSYLFESDKHVYNIGEQVKLRWIFDVPFTPNTIALYDDNTNGQVLKVFSGATATAENVNHYATISYANEGQYFPYVEVRSSTYSAGDPSTYHRIFIGNGTIPNAKYAIAVTRTVSPIYINSGSYLGEYGGTGGLVNRAGIFGFPSYVFSGFGSTGNWFIDGAQLILTPVVNAVVWVASFVYNILSQTDFFAFIERTIAPPPNATYTTPSTLFGLQLPDVVANQTFTITYQTEVAGAAVTKVLQAILGIGIIYSLLRFILT